ncbi:MAG TPA: aldolase [Methanotrichaceae archaeon]|nr:aldolase [Methanotrichaceae archaeon]
MSQWQEIARFGRKLVESGLTSSRFGNISARVGDVIEITCTGSMLDELDRAEIIEVDLQGPCPRDAVASSETCVHRAIYLQTGAQAIVHTHSPYAVAMSIVLDGPVTPIDGEGMCFLGPMPIVEGGFGSSELAHNASLALTGHNACIARGHGTFAIGKTLAEAYTAACMAEHSSQVMYLAEMWRRSSH